MSESSSSTHPEARRAEAAAALDAIAEARTALTTGIRQPRGADAQYAAAIALTIGASGMLADGGEHGVLWIAGPVMYLFAFGLLGWMVQRFRALNGMWINGYRPQAARRYAYALVVVICCLCAGSAAAGDGGRWWLVALCALLGGAAGVVSSRAWIRAYIASGGAA